MTDSTSIAVAYGDGIGLEIMEATLHILKEAKARINIETIEIGEKLYTKGYSSGISQEAWDVVKRTKILLKAPITTPQGKGYKSLNVTFRKSLGLYANIRPVASYHPFVETKQPNMDLVVVRENEEDLYAGIEYKLNPNNAIAYKLITRKGSEKIVRYAFEYAKLNNRKKVTCFVKDNIMKITDGSFHEVFKEISKEYPDIIADSMIVDIASARVASRPQDFDVIVTLNLYGDIVSDIAADVSGSVGLAGSSNVGDDFAMFEAIHGSAPDIAGRQIANPSGLLNGALMMLDYIGQGDISSKIQNAWLKTMEDGIHTADIYNKENSKAKVSTMEFAESVVKNLGKKPDILSVAVEKEPKKIKSHEFVPLKSKQDLIGVDIYISANGSNVDEIVAKIENVHSDAKLQMISYRGLKVWPDSNAEDTQVDLLRCRFIGYKDSGINQQIIADIQKNIDKAGVQINIAQNLYLFDGVEGFSKAQGE